jgi:hypothetical protein
MLWHHEDHAGDPVPTNVVIGLLHSGTPGVSFVRQLPQGEREETVPCPTREALFQTLRTFDPAAGVPQLTPGEAQACRARYRQRLPRLLLLAAAAWEEHLA